MYKISTHLGSYFLHTMLFWLKCGSPLFNTPQQVLFDCGADAALGLDAVLFISFHEPPKKDGNICG